MDRSAPAWLVLLVLVTLLAAGCGGGGRPHFERAAGWNLLPEPGQTESAANVPFAAFDRSESLPTRTVASLPRSGIVIWIESIRRADGVPHRTYPQRPLPLRLATASLTGAPEGTTCPAAAPRCLIQHVRAGESDWDTDAWIFFGAADPPPRQIAAANAELAGLRFG